MKQLILFNLFALFLCIAGSCVTPNNEPGDCITIRACQPLLKILQNRPVSAKNADYIRRSQCGFEGNDPKVCCSTATSTLTTQPKNPTNFNEEAAFKNGITTNLLPSNKECGASNNDRIVGGEITDLDEFPWMALLEYQKPNGKGFYCGGVLISKRYVLTAAHCLKGKDLPRTWKLSSVRLGEYDTSTEEDCIKHKDFDSTDCADLPLDIEIEERIPHESYNPLDTNQYHDIALLRLSRDAPFTDFIRPICIPTSAKDLRRDFSGETLHVAGWGKTENKSESNVKLKLQIPVRTTAECSSVYQNARVSLGKGQICAGGIKGKDSCRGDSGGPLMGLSTLEDNDKIWIVAGIVSFGPSPCGMQGWPGVYTKVGQYAPWIVSKMRP